MTTTYSTICQSVEDFHPAYAHLSKCNPIVAHREYATSSQYSSWRIQVASLIRCASPPDDIDEAVQLHIRKSHIRSRYFSDIGRIYQRQSFLYGHVQYVKNVLCLCISHPVSHDCNILATARRHSGRSGLRS